MISLEYKYRAKTPNGKNTHGVRNADSESELLSWIRDKGWVPIDVSRTHEVAKQIGESVTSGRITDWSEFADLSPRIKLRDKSVFFRQLATMIAGSSHSLRNTDIDGTDHKQKAQKSNIKSI